MKEQLFGLEINFEKLNAIDFKKGCYVGQENTARMKLKNKIRRQLMSIKAEKDLKIGDEITVQVIKEAYGGKGPRVTTDYSLPGSLLVLVSNANFIGISVAMLVINIP